MERLITATDPVTILADHGAVSADKHRSERLVARIQGFAGQLDRADQEPQVGFVDSHVVARASFRGRLYARTAAWPSATAIEQVAGRGVLDLPGRW
jgi:hypothetical protein